MRRGYEIQYQYIFIIHQVFPKLLKRYQPEPKLGLIFYIIF